MKRFIALVVTCLLLAMPLAVHGVELPANFTENTSGPLVSEPVTLTGFVFENTPMNANHDEMPFWELLSEDTGINFELERIATQAWTEQFNLKLVSGDLPDFMGGTYNSVQDGVIAQYAGRAFIDFSGMLDENAPNLTGLFEEDPQLKKVMRTLDGGMYAFPSYWTEVEQNVTSMPFINVRWLNELGLEMPETTEDLYDVLVAFKTQDPNGNGEQDEIPLSGHGDALEMMMRKIFAGAFGFPMYNDHLAIEQGEVYFVPATDNYKEMIKYITRLYAEELIDQELFTIDRATFVAKINQGRDNQHVGIGVCGVQEQNFVGMDSIDDYEPLIPVKGPDGHQGYTNDNSAYLRNVIAITTANENPELTVRLFDRLYSPLWSLQVFEGPIGYAIELSEDGQRYQYMTPEGDISIDQMRFTTSPVSFPYYLSDARMTELFVPDPIMMENTWNNARAFVPYLTPEPTLPVWPMSTEDGQEIAQIRVELLGYVRECRDNWVAGKSDIDADWDNFLSTLESLGSARYVELSQASYDIFNAE